MRSKNGIRDLVFTWLMDTAKRVSPKLKIKAYMERGFLDAAKEEGDTAYVAIHFLKSQTNNQMTLYETVIDILSEANSFEAAKNVFETMVAEYNLKEFEDGYVVFGTVEVVDSFIKKDDDFRAMLETAGSFVIAPGVSDVKIKYISTYIEEEGNVEDEFVVSYSDSIESKIDPVPLVGSQFVKSDVLFATRGFTFTTYNNLNKYLLRHIRSLFTNSQEIITSFFRFNFVILDNVGLISSREYVLAHCVRQQVLGNVSTVELSFVEVR